MAPTVNKLSVVLFIFISFLSSTLSIILKYPAIVNFGDSNSDTGNLISAGIENVNPPYGQTYFKLPSGRYCDGRLIVDFLCINNFLQMLTKRCCSSETAISIWNSHHFNCFDVLQWMQWTCRF